MRFVKSRSQFLECCLFCAESAVKSQLFNRSISRASIGLVGRRDDGLVYRHELIDDMVQWLGRRCLAGGLSLIYA